MYSIRKDSSKLTYRWENYILSVNAGSLGAIKALRPTGLINSKNKNRL